MSADSTRQEMHQLAMYLRQNPAALHQQPEEIARVTGAPLSVVQACLTAGPAVRSQTKREGLSPFAQAMAWMGSTFDRFTSRPWLFVLVTFLATVVLFWLLPDDSVKQTSGANNEIRIEISQIIQLSIIAVLMLLHMICYFRHAMARHAVRGALIVTTGLILLTSYSVYREPVLGSRRLVIMAVVVVGMAFVGALYAGLGIGVGLLGAYFRIRREEATRQNRTRQQLLQRLFDIEEALNTQQNPSAVPSDQHEWQLPLKRNVYLLAIVLGVLMALAMSTMSVALPFARPSAGGRAASAGAIVQMVLAFGSMFLQIFVAYLAGRPGRAVVASLLFSFSATLVGIIPIGSFGPHMVTDQLPWGVVFGSLTAILFGLFAGLGAVVEERAVLARKRKQNDPQLLLAELVEIQRILNPSEQSQCILVVDAAKSSVMKANADPLVAEWSFRSYQEFLADIVRDNHGSIHSTAGDGAIATFDDCGNAFNAARTIQSKVGDFNSYVNRLRDPFRLRIGLHCGMVTGELDQVEFAAVLDIAAHVESMSQVGGIAATLPVVEQLPHARFAELQEGVDDQRVFLALNPTLDPE